MPEMPIGESVGPSTGSPESFTEGPVGANQPGAAAAASRKERRLFPLPRFQCPPRLPGASRVVQQRRARIRKHYDNCNEVVDSLNWMAGGEFGISSPSRANPMQAQVLARVEGLVFDQKPSGAVTTPEEALRVLLRGGSPYDWRPSNETVASYQSELVSIPDDVGRCPLLTDVLPPDDSRYLEEQSELMLSRDVVDDGHLEPYWDPKLRYNKKSYHELVRRLHGINYFKYTTRPACKVGVFFVWKSSRTKLRLITDARLSNRMFKPAPGVHLMTSESFGRFEVSFEDSVYSSPEAIREVITFLGLSDVKDCFHRLRVPMWLARYFAWEAVPAKVVGLENSYVDGVFVGPLDPVYPCAGSLCQGFSWSLFFAQRANERLCRSVPLLAQARLLHDRGEPLVIRIGVDCSEGDHFYVYVDNLGVFGLDSERVAQAMEQLRVKFDGLGLNLHASEVTCGSVEALGCLVEGGRLRCRLTPARLWKVHQAVQGLLLRKRCSGRALEVIVGHLTFCGLMCRMSLSILHSAYGFIRKYSDTVGVIWPSLLNELRAFKGILFMLVQDWWRPWNRLVSSSDASLSGFGVCQAWWPKNKVAESGRRLERSRFKRLSAHSARESALQAAGFAKSTSGRWTVPTEEADSLLDAGWVIDDSFGEIPSAGLRRELWTPVVHGRWNYKEDILVLEARAVLKSLRRVLMTRYGHDVRQLVLCDNLSVVLTFERCRSRNYKVLKVLREFAAYCFARNVHLAIRWIPSELNISDEGSRLYDESSESKLLVDPLADAWAEESTSGVVPRPGGVELYRGPTGHGAKAHENLERKEGDLGTSGEEVESQVPGPSKVRGQKQFVPREGQGASLGGNKLSDETSCGQERAGDLSPYQRGGFGSPCKIEAAQDHRRGDWERKHFVRVRGREARRQKAYRNKQAKARAATFCGSPYGGENGMSKPIGNSSGVDQGESYLLQEAVRVEGVCASDGAEVRDRQRGGRGPGELLQQEVRRGRGQLFWGLHPSSAHGPCPPVWEARISKDPPGLAVPSGLAQVVPISLAACLPASSLVRDQLEDGLPRPCFKGLVQPPPGIDLPQARSPSSSPSSWTGEANWRCYKPLVGGDQLDGNFGHFQDGDEGRLGATGLGVAHLRLSPSKGAGQGRPDGTCVGLRVPRVPLSLSSLLRRPEADTCAVPSQAFGSIDRSGQECAIPRRSEKTWRMVVETECSPLREGWTSGSDVAKTGTGGTVVLSGRRALSRGDYARPQLSGDPSSWPVKKGSYLGDFFSGSGRVSRAAQALGFQTREWELNKGCNSDLTDKRVLSKIRFDIQDRRVLGGIVAPPALSFTQARDRTGVLRTRSSPWGLQELSVQDAEKVKAGNACMRSAIKIIRWLDAAGLPWSFEHPHSSKAWFLPELVHLQGLPHVQALVTDFCQWGTKWKKRTRLLAGNISPDDAESCVRQCSSSNGVCSRTHVKHVQLTGKHCSGISFTRVAQPYPHRLCHRLARALLAKYMIVPYDNF